MYERVGKYIIEGNSGTANYFVSDFTCSLSRTAVPVSVSIDQADITAVSINSGPTTSHLTANGFHTVVQTSGNVSDARVGGNYTINY
jgi:hypothetical protein